MAMGDTDKRTRELTSSAVQQGNRRWWTVNTMSYDWRGEIQHPRFSPAWFDEIDRRFIHSARLFATSRTPFDRIIPIEALRGRRVLEIGCGMGLHSEVMARAGATLTSIDLSETSVEATRRRFELKGLPADVRQMDAENLAFDAQTFDFVWSWGVIHHSSRTARVVREIARVMKPDAECRVMVYNREGTPASIALWKDHLLSGAFLTRTFEETLYRSTDGFSARYYVREQFEDLFRAFFENVTSELCGQDADVVPLPRRLRAVALQVLRESLLMAAQRRVGAFLFLTASRPT